MLVLVAAIQHDPNETEGLDGALKKLLDHSGRFSDLDEAEARRDGGARDGGFEQRTAGNREPLPIVSQLSANG